MAPSSSALAISLASAAALACWSDPLPGFSGPSSTSPASQPNTAGYFPVISYTSPCVVVSLIASSVTCCWPKRTSPAFVSRGFANSARVSAVACTSLMLMVLVSSATAVFASAAVLSNVADAAHKMQSISFLLTMSRESFHLPLMNEHSSLYAHVPQCNHLSG